MKVRVVIHFRSSWLSKLFLSSYHVKWPPFSFIRDLGCHLALMGETELSLFMLWCFYPVVRHYPSRAPLVSTLSVSWRAFAILPLGQLAILSCSRCPLQCWRPLWEYAFGQTLPQTYNIDSEVGKSMQMPTMWLISKGVYLVCTKDKAIVQITVIA